ARTTLATPDGNPSKAQPSAPTVDGSRPLQPSPGGPSNAAAQLRLEKDVQKIAYSADGKLLAFNKVEVVSGMIRQSIKIWDLVNGSELARLETQQNSISYLTFSPDGKYFAVSGSGEVYIWDLADKKLLHRDKFTNATPSLGDRVLGFSPDG